MPQLTKSLRTRIQELTTSIEAQTAERAAYERVFQMELAKETTPSGAIPSDIPAQSSPASSESASNVDLTAVEFTGNKTAFVVGIVKAHGTAGARPKEIRDVFATRKIPQSDNLIYTTLSALAKDKKLRRRDGRYFPALSTLVSKNHGSSPTKRKISAAGLKAIREANKKRWAAKRAADGAAAN
jgi:hypothetical protein